MLLQHVGDVVRLIRIADSLVERPPLEDLLDATVEVSHHRSALDDLLTLKLQHEPEHAVRRRMLRPEVEDELLGLETLVALDDRQRDPGCVLDGGLFAVDRGHALNRL